LERPLRNRLLKDTEYALNKTIRTSLAEKSASDDQKEKAIV